jgi:hypothetical protein
MARRSSRECGKAERGHCIPRVHFSGKFRQPGCGCWCSASWRWVRSYRVLVDAPAFGQCNGGEDNLIREPAEEYSKHTPTSVSLFTPFQASFLSVFLTSAGTKGAGHST